MRPATKAVIAALAKGRKTSRQLATETNYCIQAVRYSLTVIVETDQAEVVNPDARLPVYQLTGDVCECCGQVIR